MIARHITSSRGISTVETIDGTERRILPSRSVKRLNGDGAEVDEGEWERGIQLELELTDVIVSVDVLRTAFHKRGLWTSADIAAQPHVARAALADACGDVIKRIIESAGG